jgi:hypothetical protein
MLKYASKTETMENECLGLQTGALIFHAKLQSLLPLRPKSAGAGNIAAPFLNRIGRRLL